MSTSHSLINASDLLSIGNHLIEAIQQVCQLAQTHLSEASLIIEDVRNGEQR